MKMIYPVFEIARRQDALDRDKELIMQIVGSLAGACECLGRDHFQETGNYFFDRESEGTGWMFSMRSLNDQYWLHLGFIVFLVDNSTAFSYDLVKKEYVFKTEHVPAVRAKLQALVDIVVKRVPAVRQHLDDLWRATGNGEWHAPK